MVCIEWLIDCCLFSCQVQLSFWTVCLCSDIVRMCFQSKTSIRQRSRPKKSSATEGCETHPTARPKWWGKRCWFYSSSSLQTGSERKTDIRKMGGSMGGGVCVWEILQRRMLLMVRWWEFGWMGGGKLGVAEEGGKKLCEWKREEKCPVRCWLFRMACCQLLMTELK